MNMQSLKKPLFAIGTHKIYLWMIFVSLIVIGVTWMVAEALTPEFTTTDYLSGFHINHSFVGVALILLGVLAKKKMPPIMFIVLLSVGFTMIVHDATIFRELGIIQNR